LIIHYGLPTDSKGKFLA